MTALEPNKEKSYE